MARQYLPEIFSVTRENTALFNAPELPSNKIKVRILLEKSVSSVLKDLKVKFTTANMNAHQDGANRNAIVVEGIPPDDRYDAQAILNVVRGVDKGARIIS